MRSLIVAVLLALALPGLAVDFCPTGSLPDEFDLHVVPGRTYTATSCTLNGMILVDFIPNSTAPTTLSITNSVVKHILRIDMLQEWDVQLIGPLYITIANNIFEQNAGFYTRRALPSHSILTFQNNQMSSNGSFVALDTPYICFMRLRDFMFFYNSTFNIIGNTLSLNAVIENAWTSFVVFDGEGVTVKGGGKATMNILSNTMTMNNTHFGSYIQIGGIWEMIDGSSLRIDSNTFTATNTQNRQNVLSVEGISSPSGQNLLSLSNNKANLYSEDNEHTVFSVGSFTNVNLDLNNNLVNTNYYYLFRCYDPFVPESYVNVIGNTFASTGATLNYSPLRFSEYQFIDNSTLVVASNKVTATSAEETGAYLVSIDSVVIGAGATVKHCDNSLPWNSSAPAAQLFPAEVAALSSSDANACQVVTTTRPSNAFALTSTVTAFIICFLAAAVIM